MFRNFTPIVLLVACTADPLPQPPIDGSQIMLIETPQGTELRGAPGAVTVFRGDLRVTVPAIMSSASSTVSVDGSFTVSLVGSLRNQAHFVELVDAENDLFVAAYVGAPLETRVVETDPGPDNDDDGSPDSIDCAPMDETRQGLQCACVPGPDLCTGLDDDCDGLVDEDCVVCSTDVDCPAGQTCEGGGCVR